MSAQAHCSVWQQALAVTRPSLARRYLVAFLAAALIPLVVACGFIIRQQQLLARTQISQQFQTAATLQETIINEWLSSQEQDLTLFLAGQHSLIEQVLVAPNDEALQVKLNTAFAQLLQTEPSSDVVYVVARNGSVVASSNPQMIGEYRGLQNYFITGLQHTNTQFQTLAFATNTELFNTLVTATPVTNAQGEVLGVLCTSGIMHYLEQRLVPRPVSGVTSETLLVGDNHLLLTQVRDANLKPGQAYIATVPVERALALRDEAFMVSFVDYRGKPAVGMYRWLPKLNAVMVIKQDEDEAFAGLYATVRTSIQTGLAAALAAVALALLFARSIVRPVAALADTAGRIVAGDLTLRTGLQGDDELGQLGRAFDAMTDHLARALATQQRQIAQLEAAQTAVHELNSSLEQRVLERTDQLTQAYKALEGLNYSIVHDLRTPLRSIDGWSQVLLEDYATLLDATGRDYLQRIRRDVQFLSQLIDDMLRLFNASTTALHPASLDLSAEAKEIVDRLHRAEPQRQVDCRIQDNLHAFGDCKLLQLALFNLLDNAWKFTRHTPAARIEFGCQAPVADSGESVFYVRDNGAGFDMAYGQQLFAPFQRLHSSEEFAGTGIGLAIVQRIVLRHRGRVWAESAPGKGATFYFALPNGVVEGAEADEMKPKHQ